MGKKGRKKEHDQFYVFVNLFTQLEINSQGRDIGNCSVVACVHNAHWMLWILGEYTPPPPHRHHLL